MKAYIKPAIVYFIVGFALAVGYVYLFGFSTLRCAQQCNDFPYYLRKYYLGKTLGITTAVVLIGLLITHMRIRGGEGR